MPVKRIIHPSSGKPMNEITAIRWESAPGGLRECVLEKPVRETAEQAADGSDAGRRPDC